MVLPPKAASLLPAALPHGGATTVVGAVKLSMANAGDGNARTARQAAAAMHRRRNMRPPRIDPSAVQDARRRRAVVPQAAQGGRRRFAGARVERPATGAPPVTAGA